MLGTEFEVVAAAADGQSALECVRRWRPDVVVLDLEMPVLNGIDVTKELMNHRPGPAGVICSIESDPEIVKATRQAGALGYVFKARVEKDLVVAVKSAARGQSFASPE